MTTNDGHIHDEIHRNRLIIIKQERKIFLETLQVLGGVVGWLPPFPNITYNSLPFPSLLFCLYPIPISQICFPVRPSDQVVTNLIHSLAHPLHATQT